MTRQSSENTDPVTQPRSWDKALKAAGMRLLGATQAEAAEAADISERTLRKYEQCSWWAECEREARDEYLDEVRSAAYKQLLGIIRNGDEKTVRWTLERIGPDAFLPPRQKVEQEVSADVTQEDNTSNVDLSQLSDEELEQFKQLRLKMEANESDSEPTSD